MQKLSLEALKAKAEVVASEELLNSISGGLLEDCHDTPTIQGGTLDTVVIIRQKK